LINLLLVFPESAVVAQFECTADAEYAIEQIKQSGLSVTVVRLYEP
jgi:hypothetical protein